jgi:hypothetical protein
MKLWHLSLIALAATMTSRDSVAQSDAGAARPLTIAPWVDTAELAAFDAEAFPTEKSKAPTIAEWTAAPRVQLTRMVRTKSCNAARVREWVKIHCDQQTAGLRLVAGTTDGIALWVPEPIKEHDFSTVGRFGEIVFPVRQGDRRIFEFFRFEPPGEWDGWSSTSSYIVEEEWLEGGTPQIAMLAR